MYTILYTIVQMQRINGQETAHKVNPTKSIFHIPKKKPNKQKQQQNSEVSGTICAVLKGNKLLVHFA